MRSKEYQELGTTAACTMRGVKGTEGYNIFEQQDNEQVTTKRCYFGDSWFGSVKTAANIGKAGHHAVFMIKTAHARSPKKWLEDKMKGMPGGTWIVLEGLAEQENVPLVSIGYKYNKKNVLTFVMTRGAGSTAQGKPYYAKFPDKYGNVCTREVARPDVISNYFKYSNVVDLHNQARQFELALEKKWITQDGYFRIFTTFLGMNVIDAWKALKSNHKSSFRDVTVTQFSDILAQEMIEYAQTIDEDYDIICTGTADTDVSSLVLEEPKGRPISATHTKEFLKKGKQLRCVWCSRMHQTEKKTTLKCKECNRGFCRDECWANHVSFGSAPAARTKRMKR